MCNLFLSIGMQIAIHWHYIFRKSQKNHQHHFCLHILKVRKVKVSWWWSDKEVQLVNQLLQTVRSDVMILDSWENFGKFSLCPLDVKKLQKFRATITQWNTDTSPLQYLITISKEWIQACASPPLYRCHWGLEAAIPISVATPFWLSPPPALLMLP